MLEQRLKGLEDLHLTGDPRRRLGLSFHHSHPQTALVARHQTLQVFQQQLEEPEKFVGLEKQETKHETSYHLIVNLKVYFKKRNQTENMSVSPSSGI